MMRYDVFCFEMLYGKGLTVFFWVVVLGGWEILIYSLFFTAKLNAQ